MVTMAHSAANWLNTHTHVDRTHSHTNIMTVTTTSCEVPAQLLHNILESNFILKVPDGWGSKLEYPEKYPDSLPANRYHIFEEKIQNKKTRPGRESNPHPPTYVISSLGQERAPRLTHCSVVRLWLQGIPVFFPLVWTWLIQTIHNRNRTFTIQTKWAQQA